MKISGIYAIVNTVNGKRYVGSSQDVWYRIRKHKEMLRRGDHHNVHLQNAWIKHGERCFDFILLEECNIESLLSVEQIYLDAGCDYNIAKNAEAPMRGRKFSPETLIKLSYASRNRSAETIEKLRKAGTGRKLTDGEKQKIREKATGRKLSEEAKAKVGLANSKRKHSTETKKKMSESHANQSPEEKERLRKIRSEAARGKKMSDATKKKILDKRLGRTPEENAAISRKISDAHKNRTPEKDAERRKRISEAKRKYWAEKRKR